MNRDERMSQLLDELANLMTMNEAVRITIVSSWVTDNPERLFVVDAKIEVGDERHVEERGSVIAADGLVEALEEVLQDASVPAAEA